MFIHNRDAVDSTDAAADGVVAREVGIVVTGDLVFVALRVVCELRNMVRFGLTRVFFALRRLT